MIMVFKLNFNLLMPLILVYVYNVFSRKYDFKSLSEKKSKGKCFNSCAVFFNFLYKSVFSSFLGHDNSGR